MVVSVRHLPVLPYAHAVARKIVLYCGDITKLEVDAIVNAANPTLLGGGGVDGAIHRAADHPEFLAECRRLGGCRTGEAKTTNAYRLPCKSVIHTVGPVYSEHSPSEARRLLQSAYRHSLLEAVRHQLRTVAFPSISTGVYGYPKEDATKAALWRCTSAQRPSSLVRHYEMTGSIRDIGVASTASFTSITMATSCAVGKSVDAC